MVSSHLFAFLQIQWNKPPSLPHSHVHLSLLLYVLRLHHFPPIVAITVISTILQMLYPVLRCVVRSLVSLAVSKSYWVSQMGLYFDWDVHWLPEVVFFGWVGSRSEGVSFGGGSEGDVGFRVAQRRSLCLVGIGYVDEVALKGISLGFSRLLLGLYEWLVELSVGLVLTCVCFWFEAFRLRFGGHSYSEYVFVRVDEGKGRILFILQHLQLQYLSLQVDHPTHLTALVYILYQIPS